MRHRLSATHVLVRAESGAITGYYTLAAASVPLGRIPESLRKRAKMSRYSVYSATLIARLARDERWRGKGTGEILIVDALRRAFEQTAHIGAGFVLVDAVDDAAAEFYGRFGFATFPDEARQLYLAMPTVAQLFGKGPR